MKVFILTWIRIIEVIILFHSMPSILLGQNGISDSINDRDTFYLFQNRIPGDFFLPPPTIFDITGNKPDVLLRYPLQKTNDNFSFKNDYVDEIRILNFKHGYLNAFGKRESLIGLGIINRSELSYTYNFNNRLTVNSNLNTTKYSLYHYKPMFSIGLDLFLSYKIRENMTFNAFGSYSISNYLMASCYGAYLGIEFNRKSGTNLGFQSYYDSFTKTWDTVPIVAPYYKINDKFEIGMDFGGIIKEVVIELFK